MFELKDGKRFGYRRTAFAKRKKEEITGALN